VSWWRKYFVFKIHGMKKDSFSRLKKGFPNKSWKHLQISLFLAIRMILTSNGVLEKKPDPLP